ncbi:4Fe-4S dicluster domain-containing protein [Myxococcota bacterium]|nr:4Fe-4S dicluster domain-containing protein [Myxococcota bacterium]
MGHHIGSKSSIIPLIDRLNKYPVGLPDREKLRKILSLLFSEDEAFIASKFPLEETTVDELSKITKISPVKLIPILNQMCDKGLVMDIPYEGQDYYLLLPGLIGFFELTFMKSRVDLPKEEVARLMHEYLYEDASKGMANEFFDSKTPLTRTLPYEDQIPVSSQITSYENAREIIKNASFVAVGTCYCRHKKHHLGQDCAKGAPMENICISLGAGAEFFARRGFAEKKTVEETLQVLDRARSFNLTHITDNIRQRPSFICNCCSCCCELLVGYQKGYHEGVAKAQFTLNVDENICNGCGLCIKACNVSAIELIERKKPIQVKEDICLGCGACISACHRSAISLTPKRRAYIIPKDRRTLMKQRLLERGRVLPFVIYSIKRKLKRKKTNLITQVFVYF